MPRLRKRLKRRILSRAALAMARIAPVLPTPSPLVTAHWACQSEHRSRQLLVFLPGIDDVIEDYEFHGLLDAVRRLGLPADLTVVDAHIGYYVRRNVMDRLHRDVIAPAREQGYESIWLVGISLGGLGSILYSERFGEDVDGLFLLAPFVGRPAILHEIQRAGGLAAWSPQLVGPLDYQRRLWLWLRDHTGRARSPQIWLGYGENDKFAQGNRLLARLLPPGRVFLRPGGHDWRTWAQLWHDFLKVCPLHEGR